MKAILNYIAHVGDAAIKHLTFITDHSREAVIAFFSGVALWLIKFAGVHLFNDMQYLGALVMMMFLNSLTGIGKARYMHRQHPEKHEGPSAKVFADKTLGKIVYYAIVLNSIHTLTTFKIGGEDAGKVFFAVKYGLLMTMIVSEFWSIQSNFKAMGKTTFFDQLYEGIRQFLPGNKKSEE